MSDLAAAQRDARRRKITQNAQARMNKLMGRHDLGLADSERKDSNNLTPRLSPAPNPPTEEGDQNQPEPQSTPPAQASPYNLRRRQPRSESPAATSVIKKTVTQSIVPDESPPLQEETVDPAPKKTTHVPTLDTLLERERPIENDGRAETTKPTLTSEPLAHDSTTTVVENQRLNTFDAKALEVLRIVVCIMTSFISRLVLSFGFGLFMVESIFLPFFAMELFFTYIMETYLKDSVPVQPQGTLVSAALMLCGIKPELMGVYQKIMSHIAMLKPRYLPPVFTLYRNRICFLWVMLSAKKPGSFPYLNKT